MYRQQNERSNTKRQADEHLTNNQNITQRKKQPQKIQNKTNEELYWIDNLSPELTDRSSRSEVFLRKGVLKICSNFIKIALRHGCSRVNLLHVFRTAFPRNTSGRLLLNRGKLPNTQHK